MESGAATAGIGAFGRFSHRLVRATSLLDSSPWSVWFRRSFGAGRRVGSEWARECTDWSWKLLFWKGNQAVIVAQVWVFLLNNYSNGGGLVPDFPCDAILFFFSQAAGTFFLHGRCDIADSQIKCFRSMCIRFCDRRLVPLFFTWPHRRKIPRFPATRLTSPASFRLIKDDNSRNLSPRKIPGGRDHELRWKFPQLFVFITLVDYSFVPFGRLHFVIFLYF